MKAETPCTLSGCLCETSDQPITDAVYGEKSRKRGDAEEYVARGGRTAIWRAITERELNALADLFPKARRFAARRKESDG